MNFNELEAYWLVERLACLWVTKPWEMTLSCQFITETLFTGFPFLNLQFLLPMPIGAFV